MEYKEYIKLIKEDKIKPVCIMTGDEEYVKASVIEKLKKAYLDETMIEFDMSIFDNLSANYDNLMVSLSSPAMASKRKIVIVTVKPENSIFKDERLIKLTESLSNDILFIMDIDGKIDKRLTVVKKIEPLCDIVSFEVLERGDLIKWILQKCKAGGKKISNADAEYMLSLVGEDLYRLECEIAKLIDYNEEENITRQDIDNMIAHTPEHGVFLLVDAVAAKKTSDAVKQCRLLLNEGTEAFQLLALLERQYQLLLRYLSCVNKMMPQKDIMDTLALKSFVYDKLKRQAAGYTMESCKNALQKCLELDFAVKNGKADSKTGFEMLIVGLSMKK